jgi:hypothetical protein
VHWLRWRCECCACRCRWREALGRRREKCV